MSGFGLPWNYDKTRLDEWLNVLGSDDTKHVIPENVLLLRAVYKKGDPHYCNAYNGNRNDYMNFLWEDSSFKKVITPTAQAYLIMNEIMLAKYLYSCSSGEFRQLDIMNEKKILSLLLINSAIIQAQFLSDYLRNHDGLFVAKLDKSNSPYGEPVLEKTDQEPAVFEQALAMKAFSMLSHTLDNDEYPLFKNTDAATSNIKYAQEIYTMFLESSEDIYKSKTKELCNVIEACIELYNSSPEKTDMLDNILRLSLELESRIDMSGNLFRFSDENVLTSNSSSFIALKTLIQSYRITGIFKFLHSATTLYKKLDLLWDPSCSLYALDSEDRYKYTLRDVGSVIGGLNSVRLFGEESYRSDSQDKLVSFFNSAVNASKIIHSSTPPPSPDDCEACLNGLRAKTDDIVYEDFCCPEIPHSLECGIAPVFAKKFTYKPKKHKFAVNSSGFYTDYALYTTHELFYMNYPLIECFYGPKI